jgi:hypothetical protein
MRRFGGIILALAFAGAARAADPCATTVGSVSGTVSSAGGGPIAGARVRVQACLGAPVVTDAAGAFTIAVPAGSVVVAAAADEHYNGCWKGGQGDCVPVASGASGLAIMLDPLPTDDDPAHVFRAPETCKVCHPDIYDQWTKSSMAVTNRNRWVDNLYNGTDIGMPPGLPADALNPPYFGFLASHVRRNPDGSAKILPGGAPDFRLGECANCHQPEYVGTSPTSTDFNAFTAPDVHAVTCAFCHHVTDVDVSADGIRRPNLVVGEHGLPAKTTMRRSSLEPWLVFGPYEDATFDGVTDMRAAQAPVMQSSRLCAACHEDHADPRDTNDDFRETYAGPPSQTTYSEWAASDFAAKGVQCQDCHMPPVDLDAFCNRVNFTRDKSQVRSHEFPGTTPEMLQSAVTLHAHSAVEDGALAVRVEVTNSGAGHDLPTGVTLRNLILVVTATTKDGTALAQVTGADGGPRIPNWGGSGTEGSGNFAGMPGKGYARVLTDENLVENVLFTEAYSEFDGRIKAGATDATTYRFTLPKNFAKEDVRIATALWYRRAFKPLADQRKWTQPLNGNPNGTRGDGTDYDGGLVIAARENRLTCRGKLAKVKAEGHVTDGTLTLATTLKLPKGKTIDPATDGAQVTAGVDGAPTLVVDEPVSGFTTDDKTVTHTGTADEPVASLALTTAGKRAYKTALTVRDVGALLGPKRIVLGLETGDVCARKTLRCKAKSTGIRCR